MIVPHRTRLTDEGALAAQPWGKVITMSLTVNFLVVGTQKGGTTALAKFLAGHPDICMAPEKELHHFDAEPYEVGPAADQRYHRQITHLLNHFPRHQVLFIKNEDLRDRHEQTMAAVLAFLGTSSSTIPPSETVNADHEGIPLGTRERAKLSRIFASEIDALESLLGWDLSAWRG